MNNLTLFDKKIISNQNFKSGECEGQTISKMNYIKGRRRFEKWQVHLYLCTTGPSLERQPGKEVKEPGKVFNRE